MLQKIKSSKLLWFFLIIAELLILCVSGFVYSRREGIELNFTQEDLIYNNGDAGFYLDKSYNYKYIATPEFMLPKGLYTLKVQYERSGALKTTIEVCYPDEQYEYSASGKLVLSDENYVSSDFRIKYSDRPIHVRGRLTGDAADGDYILIRSLSILPSAADMRNFLFKIALFFIIADLLVFLYFMKDKFNISADALVAIKVIVLLIIFSSIPLMVDFIWSGHDLKFHLTRIEGLKEGLLAGMFPVKIQPNWLDGHGYAVSVFYGDALLYIPALLRIFGVSIQASYQFYILLINALTVLIAYYCFSKMGGSRTGLVCSAIYTLNIFRLYDVYGRAAVGEYTAMAFIPLVLYGFWCVYMLSEASDEHRKSWLPICFGCTGIFLSHMITTEMTAFFVLITVIVFWRKTFRKENFVVLIKAAAAIVCLNLWFLLPFLDYMMSGGYVINNTMTYTEYKLEDRGGFLAQFFMTDYSALAASNKAGSGSANDLPCTVGLSAMAVLAVWLIFCVGEKKRNKSEKAEEYFAVFIAILSLLMTTCLFPYTWFVQKLPVLKLPVQSIQYSWRFFTISGAALVYLLCIILRKEWLDNNKKKLLAGVLVGISLWQSVSYMSAVLNECSAYRIYHEGSLDSFDVVFGEYIPMDRTEKFNLNRYMDAYADDLTYDAASLSVEEWHREDYAVSVSLTNNSGQTAQLEVPLLLYKGYKAAADTGEKLQISPGESYRISVAVPAGFSGSFKVSFSEPWYWRVCEVISLLTFAGLIAYIVYAKRKSA